jgi:N-acetylglutamate synthase-like GNAT family acetyltransferase
VYDEQGEQVGFARVISDFATFGYLADVFILQAHRGQGLSKLLLTEIMSHPRLQNLRRFCLATADAHTLYQQFGFTPLTAPETMMEVRVADIYQQLNNTHK